MVTPTGAWNTSFRIQFWPPSVERKGAVDAISRYVSQNGQQIAQEVQATLDQIARSGARHWSLLKELAVPVRIPTARSRPKRSRMPPFTMSLRSITVDKRACKARGASFRFG